MVMYVRYNQKIIQLKSIKCFAAVGFLTLETGKAIKNYGEY